MLSIPSIDSRITYLQQKMLVAALVKEKRITHRPNLDTSVEKVWHEKNAGYCFYEIWRLLL